ncbi:MAG: methyltransferase domain-containing protein [Acidimicrobiia bacterium]|nr:methyltransferase domain-containing protein [Acidimicrobiia bacterium]
MSGTGDYFSGPLVAPAPPSAARYERLVSSPHSLSRELIYEKLESIELRGRTLDIGGGRAADYADRLHGASELVSVNLAAEMEPTTLSDVREPLPFADESFDTVISLNTLEHLPDDVMAAREAWRVLRPGGELHLLVPFLFRDHPSPDDYHRHTAQGWSHVLSEAGIDVGDQRIEPLCWDPLATAFAIADVAPLGKLWWRCRGVMRRLVLKRPLLLGRIGRWNHDPISAAQHALGFAVTASKR